MNHSENPFVTGVRKVIPAVLIYVRKNDEILMIHRNAKDRASVDTHQGKWNGLGGKCERDESPLDAAVREVKEESGLDLPVSSYHALGVIQFPNFNAQKSEDWIVFVFTAEWNSQQPYRSSSEGDLHWVSRGDLTALNLWPGDFHFIPFVLEKSPFLGTIWYEDLKVIRVWFQKL